jgi:hypothetical protein
MSGSPNGRPNNPNAAANLIKGKGAPKGKQSNFTKNKPWREAVRNIFIEDPESLREVALKTLEMALAGDIQAIREIGDRLDGKPQQAIKADVGVTDHRVDAPPRTESYEEWQKRHDLESTTGATTTRH